LRASTNLLRQSCKIIGRFSKKGWVSGPIMPKRRLLFVVPSLRRAGAEIQVVQLVNGLAEDVFDKNLVSYLDEDELRDDIRNESVSYYNFRRTRKIDLAVARKIARIIDDKDIDVVHCTLENALLYGVLALHFAEGNPRLISAIHTTRHPTWKHVWAERLIYRHLLQRCAQVWFMSESQAQLWIERMPFLRERHRVIYNGVDCTRFDPHRHVQAGRELRNALGISQDARVLCSIAGLRPEKLHTVLLHAFRNLTEVPGFDCYLLLAGSGPMESELKTLVDDLHLNEKVRFLGELPDVRPLLAASDCKVLCSAAETFSMAMLEAMAMGVPVISTRVGGSGDAITDGQNGILITPGDVDELAGKIQTLLADSHALAEMGRLARQTVREKFSYGTMVERSGGELQSICSDI